MDKETTSKTIRLANARTLAFGEKTKAIFAEKLGVDPSRVSQIIGKNPTKGIGDDTARQLERAYDKPLGWMDVDHSEEATALTEASGVYLVKVSPKEMTFLTDFWTLSPERQKTVMEMVAGLAKAFPAIDITSVIHDQL